MTISLEQPERWRAALDGVPHAFGHTWESCHAMSLTSGQRTELFLHEESTGRAVCPFAERSFEGHVDVVTPYGFSGFAVSGSADGLERAWRALAARRGWVAGYIGLHPLFTPEGLFAADRVKGQALHILDLTVPEERTRARLAENRRREVSRWQRDPPRLTWSPDAVVAFVRRHFRDCHRRRGAGEVYMLGDDTLAALCCADGVFATAAGRDAIEAVCLFGHTAYEGQYLFNVCTDAGRPFTTGLLWEGQRRLRALGVPKLNLGGGIRPDPGDGVAVYKSRFGGDRLSLEALRHVYRADVYDALCRRVGVDPSADGYFPAFRRAPSAD